MRRGNWLRLLAALSIAPTAVLAASALGAPESPASESRSALEAEPRGWKNLLPGRKLKGWTRLPVPATGTLGREQWHVDPDTGHLVCDGDGGHDWLRYDRELGDFIYHVEWRYFPVEGKTGYNSGVYARSSADGGIWHQAQVGSAFGGYLFGQTLVGGEKKGFNFSRDLKTQRVRPAGEWNTYEITCRGRTMSLWVNGGTTNDWQDCEVPRGYVGLEGEGWKIEFRSLRLKELR